MSTATMAPRVIKSPKYAGWEILRFSDTEFLMTRPNGIYAIGVGITDQRGWEGTLLTRQRGVWMPAKTPYVHAVLGCVIEADRREKVIAKHAARPLAGLGK